MRKPFLLLTIGLFFMATAFSQTKIDFENLSLAENSYWDGESSTLGVFNNDLSVNGIVFHNTYSRSDWGYGITESFSGFAYSKVTDNTTAGIENQYSCIAGSGADGSAIYGLFYGSAGLTVDFETALAPTTIALCNTTYAYLSMQDGDAFAKKFGGESGDDPDYFLVRIVGIATGARVDSLDFYLADYRFEDNSEDYLVKDWTEVDLSGFGEITSLEFSLYSSDMGNWGMNTPAYFCIDNLNGIDLEELTFTSGEYWNGSTGAMKPYNGTFTCEPATFGNVYTLSDWGYGMTGSFTGWAFSNTTDTETAGHTNQFSAIAGSGADASANYALCYNSRGQDTIHLNQEYSALSVDITNGTYPYLSMRDGDGFAKKFGGESGDDPDFFLLTITGLLDGTVTNTIDFYLADYRFEDKAQDYIVDSWTTADLGALGQVDQIVFSLSSSDVGDWGMNTPAYFFIDNLSLEGTSGIQDPVQITDLKIYPNPALNDIIVESTDEISRIEVWSISGQLLHTEEYKQPGKQIRCDVSPLRPGHYLVRVKAGNSESTIGLIKN